MSTRPVLDHGHVTLVESWGSDERIIESARMSTGKGFLGWDPRHVYVCSMCGYRLVVPELERVLYCNNHPGEEAVLSYKKDESHPGDMKLLTYLWSNRHTTPFEMAGAMFEIKAPIFVFREWHRHRTQSFNEMSARYTPLPNEHYLPTTTRLLQTSTTNKQAGGSGKVPTNTEIEYWLLRLKEAYAAAESAYSIGLAYGVPKELARLPVPVARYSKMRASANLWNWLRFLQLRCAANAQWEIRQYAQAVQAELASLFPRTMQLYMEGDTRP